MDVEGLVMAIIKDGMRWAWDVHWLTHDYLRWAVRRLVERGEPTDSIAEACQVSPETATEWKDWVMRQGDGDE